jgi:hypothetical protein
VKVLYGIHVRETQKKELSKQLHGLKYIGVRSAVGEAGGQILFLSRKQSKK